MEAMNLETYCPEIARIKKSWPNMLSDQDKADLIAAALIRRIKEKGEWEKFTDFSMEKWTDSNCYVDMDVSEFTAWLTDPSTLIRVAGEWAGRKES